MHTLSPSAVLACLLFAPLAAQARFEPRSTRVIPQDALATHAVVAADLDGDGCEDLVLSLAEPDPAGLEIRLLFNGPGDPFLDRSATHLPPPPAPSNRSAADIAVGDLDGDGDPDIVVLRYPLADTWLRNDGTGHFTDAGSSLLPQTPLPTDGTLLVDLDHDGDLDLVTNELGEILLWGNDGTGRFVAAGQLNGALAGTVHCATDLDGDGTVDFVGTRSDHRVVWFGNRNAPFDLVVLSPNLRAEAVLAADLDGDGDDDLVFATGDSAARDTFHEVHWNDGARNFRRDANVPLAQEPANALATVDLESDGDLDLLFGSSAGAIRVWRNDGPTGFVDLPRAVAPFQMVRCLDLATLDVENDGDLDVFVGGTLSDRLLFHHDAGFIDPHGDPLDAATGSQLPRMVDVDGDDDLDYVIGRTNAVTLRRSDATLALGPPELIWSDPGLRYLRHLEFGDLDGDGDPDAWVTLADGKLQLLVNDGSGSFSEESVTRLPAGFDRTNANVVRLLDLDADGDLDVAIATGWGAAYSILENDGTGRFTLDPLDWPAGGNAADLEAGDLDGDGDVDLLVLGERASGGYGYERFLNDGAGRFRVSTAGPLPSPTPGEVVRSFELADVDGDDAPDILDDRLRLWSNDGAGGFPLGRQVTTFRDPDGLVLADLDGDGDLDLVLGDQPDGSAAFANDGAGNFTDATTAWLGPRPPAMLLPIGVDFDGDSDVDLLLPGNQSRSQLLRNRGNDLDAPLPARLGATFELELTRTDGQLAGFVYGLTLLPTPLRLPFGTLRLDTTTSLVADLQVIANDRANSHLALPLVPAAAGVALYAQALNVDGRGDDRLTNLVRAIAFP